MADYMTGFERDFEQSTSRGCINMLWFINDQVTDEGLETAEAIDEVNKRYMAMLDDVRGHHMLCPFRKQCKIYKKHVANGEITESVGQMTLPGLDGAAGLRSLKGGWRHKQHSPVDRALEEACE